MVEKTRPRKIIIFEDANGKEPFTKWLKSLRNTKARARIMQRLRMVERGNIGDVKSLGGNLFELRFFFGAGYRVYFGEHRRDLIVLLLGGDKSGQGRDIDKAQGFTKRCHQRVIRVLITSTQLWAL